MVESTAARRTLDLVRELSEHPGALDRTMRLEDLGFDSLAFAELAVALEDEQGIDVGDPLLDGTGTVGDLLEVVERADVARSTVDVPSGVGRLQRLADAVGGIGLRAWIRVEVMGAEGVPRYGPAILATTTRARSTSRSSSWRRHGPSRSWRSASCSRGRSPRGRCASSGGSVWTASASTSGRSGSPIGRPRGTLDLMRWLIRDPRIRFLVLLVVVLLGLALAWHLAGEHPVALGACVAILAASMVWALPGPWVRSLVPAHARVTTRIPAPQIPSPGRHPPAEGTVLRL